MKVEYIPNNWEVVKTNNYIKPNYNYGSKLSTDYIVINEKMKRKVFAICYSNVASFYIVFKGKRLFIPDSMFP